MTVTNTTRKAVLVPNGNVGPHPFPFRVQQASDMYAYRVDPVTLVETPLVQGSNPDQYQVTINQLTEGGSITLGSTLAATFTTDLQLLMVRDVDDTQQTRIPTSSPFPEKAVENSLDKLTMRDIEINETLKRAFRAPISAPINFDGTLPTLTPNRLIKINADGTGLDQSANDPDLAAAAAEAAAAQAIAAAAAAAGYAQGLNLPGTLDQEGRVLGVKRDGSGETEYKGLTNLFSPTTEYKDVYLVDYPMFNATRGVDCTTVIQGIINGFPVNSAIRIIYPDGDTWHGDVTDNGRTVCFTGREMNTPTNAYATRIYPAFLTKGLFQLKNLSSSVCNMEVDDRVARFALTSLNPSDTRAIVLVGEAGSGSTTKVQIKNFTATFSRAQGIRSEGGPFLTLNNVSVYGACSGGIYLSDNFGGDNNHGEAHNVTVSRCFNFGIKGMKANNAGGGWNMTGYVKSFQNQNSNFHIEGNGWDGPVFIEQSNITRVNFTTVIGEKDVQIVKDNVTSVFPGMILVNPTTIGYPLGTYVEGVNYDTGVVTLNNGAPATQTYNLQVFQTQEGNRRSSLYLGTTAQGHTINAIGDQLDPACIKDDSPGGANLVTTADNGQTYFLDLNAKQMRLVGIERRSTDPNKSLHMTAVATLTNGSAVITLDDPKQALFFRTTAPITCPGGWTGTFNVNAVDNGLGQITLNNPVTGANGKYLVKVRANMRGGVFNAMVDDLVYRESTNGANLSQVKLYTSRGSQWMGYVNGTTLVVKKMDNESQPVGNNLRIHGDPAIIAPGTTISSFTGPDADNNYTITMSQAALANRSGVWVLLVNPVGIRQVFDYMITHGSNAAALAAGTRYLDEMYRQLNGKLRAVVPAAQDGRYSILDTSGSIAAGATYVIGPFTSDSNGGPGGVPKALANVMLGDFVRVSTSRDMLGLIVTVVITATNTMKIYVQNPTAAAINPGVTTYRIEHDQA